MCIICEGNYDDNLIELYCNNCKTIKEIPILPNLQRLDCDFGNFYNTKTINEFYAKQKIRIKLLNLYRLHKKWKTLWKIAEYYTMIKISS